MGILLKLWLLFPQRIRLWAYQLLVRVGLRLYGPTTSFSCFRLPFNLYAKAGYGVDVHEANALRFISQHVAGPLPSLVDVIPYPRFENGMFIVMTRLPGKPLALGLWDMSPEQRSLLASDLKRIIDQMRSIPPPQTGPKICAVDGGPVLCYRVCVDRVGPFETEADFYQWLSDRLVLEEQDRLKAFAKPVHSKTHPIYLTHNDFSPQNILVDENGRLTGLVDWACLSWFPQYWEWTRSYYAKESYGPWREMMDKIFGRYEEELAVEQELWKYTSPW
ncbi:kinase-like protein [Heliocybe sulcata]|uniref:Kinase-like protein n=1 Tax=Heliocybe sulcata TaxID=5364 RepID=A0A5C3NI23_9AGAM|nr:kinase-like protein [Heliocybe sulcata]